MQSSAPYLEGDNYYSHDSSKSTENETEINSVNSENKKIIDEETLTEQLHKTEEEIATLRQVLNVKLKLSQDLKRQLGITAINEMKGDIIHGINTIKESNTFKATSVVMKNMKEKTSNTFSTASTKFSQKLGLLRNTNTVKSIENKMETAYTSVKKVPCKYNPGDKIFAKVKGFVYWPARVNPLPGDITIPPNKIPIFFYGTHEVYFISPTSCWPYDEKNKSKWGKPRPRAYFNQGMDEIENYSTIYQFGIDPLAEDFLSQFYQFKQSNGQNSTPKLLNKYQSTEENSDEREKEQPKKSSKKRNKSGSSVSMKENKTNSKSTESSVSEMKMESTIEIKEELSVANRKRRISESELSSKENKDTIDNMEESGVVSTDNQCAPTRKRQKSESSDIEQKIPTLSRKLCRRKPKSIISEVVTKERLFDNIDKSNDEPIVNCKQIPTEQVDMKNELKLILFSGENVEGTESGLSELVKLESIDQENQSHVSHQSDLSEDIGPKPTTRCRAKSSSTKLSNNMSVINEKSDVEDSDSPSVDSDNLADEDFRPAFKGKRLTKKTKIQKRVKSPVKKTTTPSKKPASRQKSISKKKPIMKPDTDDSMSSVSSVEDWKTRDEKLKKEYEEKMRMEQRQQLEMEEKAVKEARKRSKAKRMSDSMAALKEVSNAVPELVVGDKCATNTTISDSNTTAEDLNDCKLDKEIVVQISKSDIDELNGKFEVKDELKDIVECKISVESSGNKRDCDILLNEMKPELFVKKTFNLKVEDLSESVNDDEPKLTIFDTSIKFEECQQNKTTASKITEIPTLSKTEEKVAVIVLPSYNKICDKLGDTPIVEKIKKVKINLKELRSEKSTNKGKATSRKRNRKISSSISSGSDVEIVNVKPKDCEPKSKRSRIVEKSSESDDSKIEIKQVDKCCSTDRLSVLQAFNVDIRSSLVLGLEDYRVCLERFKSLCEMDIDLVSLVKVWQLMDTVKKCRRYKRNEKIKQEAQAVYKRFMEIYSRASKEEVNTAQSLLAQYRHQNNSHNQHVSGMDSNNKTNGGSTSHGLTIPISVADMFQTKLSSQFESKLSSVAVSVSSNQSNTPHTNTNQTDDLAKNQPRANSPTEEQINEEKMRLLSVDLEAKVSDILNKIEKNVDTNPINQRSLSHLLPVSSGDSAVMKLPTQWKTVGENRSTTTATTTTAVDNKEYEISDVDEDDVEAIVRRIEEVAIKLTEPEVDHSSSNVSLSNSNGGISSGSGISSGGFISGCGGISSALDARIENLINNSFISTKETTRSAKKPRVSSSSSSRHHKRIASSSPARGSSSNVGHGKPELPESVIVHHHQQQQLHQHHQQHTSETAKSQNSTISLMSNVSQTEEQETSSAAQEEEGEQKDDIEIYDLLGV